MSVGPFDRVGSRAREYRSARHGHRDRGQRELRRSTGVLAGERVVGRCVTWAPQDRAVGIDRATLVRANRGKCNDLAGTRLGQDDRFAIERRRHGTAHRNIAELGDLLATAA